MLATKDAAAKRGEGFQLAEAGVAGVAPLPPSVVGGSIAGELASSLPGAAAGVGEAPGRGAAVALGSHSAMVV
jgi:hypothetical protein